ncbi:ABC transporter substrate-binding protein [Paenibacillus solisilvae]|uniref:ABC transporter substrate-binding protein n=1 Tax=Paenibacillus solisilvae TaxID=2486751 RepID=A0ABW0W1I0_9BACL
MKKSLVLLLSILLCISLAACTNDSKQTANNNSQPPSTQAATPTEGQATSGVKTGGILKYAQSADPNTLDPYIYATEQDRNTFLTIFNSLMEYDPKTLKPVPGIIKEAKLSDDGLTYDLTIQSDVTFHNGRKLTADDVKFSLQKAMRPEATRTADLLKSIKDIKTVDDTHLTVSLSNRDNLLLDSFIEVFVTPNDPSIDQSKNPVGTGPFMFVQWNRNEKVVVKKNPNYWKKGLPYLDGIEFITVPDQDVKLLQLTNGQVDAIDVVPTSKVTEVSNNTNLQLSTVPVDLTVSDYILLLNNSKTPFNNLKFRQAVNYSLQRNKIKQALFGNFVVRSTSVPTGDSNYNPDTPQYQYDLTKAKALLKESGYNNEKLELLYHKIDISDDIISQIIEQSLQDLGINAELKGVEVAQWVDNVFNKKQFDMAITYTNPKPNTVDMLYHVYGAQNGAALQWDNKPWYDKLLSVRQLPSNEGSKVLKDLQAQVVDQTPNIVIGGHVLAAGLSKNVQGFIPDPQSKVYFESVWKN